MSNTQHSPGQSTATIAEVVAAAEGWKNVRMLKDCYQQPDMATMLEVVQGGPRIERASSMMTILHTLLHTPPFEPTAAKSMYRRNNGT